MTRAGLAGSIALVLAMMFGLSARAEELLTGGAATAGCRCAPHCSHQHGDDDCCCDDRDSFWFAGTETTFMGMNVRSGGQVTMTLNDSTTVGTDLQIRDGNGMEDVGFAPRIWLGRQINERWAVVGRYWNLSDSAAVTPALVPGTVTLPNFATFLDTARVELYSADIEAVRSMSLGAWKFDASVGARFASFRAEDTVRAFGVFTTGNFINLQMGNNSQFDGAGVTAGLTARRQFGDLPLFLFISGRGSSLDGLTDSSAFVSGTVAVSGNNPLVGAATVSRNNADATLSIAEFQVGLQWEFELRALPVNGFFRVAFEYQNWAIDGLPTGGAGFSGTLGNLTTNTFSSAGQGDANLYGLAIATGLSW